MKIKFPLFLLLLSFFPALAPAQSDPLSPSYAPAMDTLASHYPTNIWVTDTMQKVRQDSGAPGTNHWGTFYGTQGEFVDFQVHVQAPSGGYSALTISSSGFVQTAPASFTIPAPDSSHTNVLVYREAYYHVTTISSTASVYYGSNGFYPDALIPTIDPYYHQTTNAFPFAVAAGSNQSAWVDVFIPQNAPSGYYSGTITVSNNGATLAKLPIVLAVWQWPVSQGGHMPATSTLPTDLSYGAGDFCNMNYPGTLFNSAGCNVGTITYPHGETGTNVDGAAMFLDHRWTLDDPVDVGNTANATTYYGPLFGGTSGANVNTIIPGAKSTGAKAVSISNSLQTWDTYVNVSNRSAWSQMANYDYAADEPGSSSSAWSTLCNRASTDHSLTPALATLVTSYISALNANNGANCVDILVVPITTLDLNPVDGGPSNTRSQYNSWLSHTNPDGITPQLWSYLACSSDGSCGNGTIGGSSFNYPNYNVDSKPTGNRAQEWMTYLHQQTGELYYEATCAWENACFNSTQNDPWVSNLYAFGNNGDGTLAYPSHYQCSSHCGSDPTPVDHVTLQSGAALGTPIWIPSMRLKNMRDGMQDWEYMHLLTDIGNGTFVNSQVTSWITNSYTYEYTGSGLQSARKNLGTALHQLTYSNALLPPTNLQGTVQ